MLTINDMKLGDLIALVDALRGGKPADAGRPESAIDHGMAVVVLDRGFVYVGQTTTDADWCIIRDARNIRYWGTTKGLGQLVQEGPNSNTKIDPAGTVKAPMRALIAILPTKEELWKKS